MAGLSGTVWSASDPADPYGGLTNEDFDYREELEAPWVEDETRVGKGPSDGDLTPLELLHLPPGMRLSADLEHLAVGADHVARLWLVVRSGSGAYNGSYEGFRCATGEYKVYAYYNPHRSKPLRRVRLPRWRAIRPDSYRDELAREVLCSSTRPRDPDQVRARPLYTPNDNDIFTD